MQAGRMHQILAYGDKPLLKGAWSQSRGPSFKFCPNHIFVIGEAALQIPCADWCRGVRVHAWYITPERDVFRVTWLLSIFENKR